MPSAGETSPILTAMSQEAVRATGIGSLPGTSIAEALDETFGELDFPYLPELPARGAGADIIGRSAAFLVDMPVEIYVGRWRIAARAGADMRRTQDFLARDLDALTERAEGYTGPLKIQSAGPWTLAAGLELALGGKILKDHGGVRDTADSLAEGLRLHVQDVRRRVPGAQIVLQLDEPSLPAVLKGQIPTESTLHTYRSVEPNRARDTLRSIVDAVGVPVVMHCCAADAPLALLRDAGAAGVAVDLSLIKHLDPLGELIDAGLSLYAGVASASGIRIAGATVPPSRPARPTDEAAVLAGRVPPGGSARTASESAVLADRVLKVWNDLGFPHQQMARQVVVTPTCGLAGATPAAARAVLAACREAARRLSEV